MTEEFIVELAREAMYTILLMAGPILIVSLLVGLTVSIFQATTQIQEQTLTFVPKIVAVFFTLLIFGAWMLNLLVTFTLNLFRSISLILH